MTTEHTIAVNFTIYINISFDLFHIVVIIFILKIFIHFCNETFSFLSFCFGMEFGNCQFNCQMIFMRMASTAIICYIYLSFNLKINKRTINRVYDFVQHLKTENQCALTVQFFCLLCTSNNLINFQHN